MKEPWLLMEAGVETKVKQSIQIPGIKVSIRISITIYAFILKGFFQRPIPEQNPV